MLNWAAVGQKVLNYFVQKYVVDTCSVLRVLIILNMKYCIRNYDKTDRFAVEFLTSRSKLVN